jgi:hypothetical protein
LTDEAKPDETAGPPTAPVVPAQGATKQQIPSEPTKRQAEPWALRHWRPLMVLIILLISAGIGFYYKSYADPGHEGMTFASKPPQRLDIYVSDPRVSVQATLDIACTSGNSNSTSCTSPFAQTYAYLDLAFKAPRGAGHAEILVISNLTGGDYDFNAVPRRYGTLDNRSVLRGHIYETRNTLGYLKMIHLGDRGIADLQIKADESFRIPNVLQEVKGVIYGHLPALGSQETTGYPSDPLILTENQPGSRYLTNLIYNPAPLHVDHGVQPPPNLVSSYAPLHGGNLTLFWRPKDFSVAEVLENVTPTFARLSTGYMTPSGSTLGNNYVWNSHVALEPTFKLINQDAVDSQSRAAFISGISFGVAGAAAIALVQELPKDIPLPVEWSVWRGFRRSAKWARSSGRHVAKSIRFKLFGIRHETEDGSKEND